MELSKNLSILKKPNFDVSKITLFGVKLGDNISNIQPNIITATFPHGTPYVTTNLGISYCTHKINATIIEEFQLSSKFLVKLNLDSLDKIETIMGLPSETEMIRDFLYLFYFERQMVIKWHPTQNKLDSISLGKSGITPTYFKAIDLLLLYLKLKSFLPEQWHIESILTESPENYVDFLKLLSLTKAFNTNYSDNIINSFGKANFLLNRESLDLGPVVQDLDRFLWAQSVLLKDKKFESLLKKLENDSLTFLDTRFIFKSLLNYIDKLRTKLGLNITATKSNSSLAKRKIANIPDPNLKMINEINLENLKIYEKTISYIIDPHDLVFTKGQLIREFDFPKEN